MPNFPEDLSLIFQALPIVLIALDQDGRVVFANRHAEHMVGLQPGEHLGADWIYQFIPEECRSSASKHFKATTAATGPSACRLPLISATGETHHIEWTSLPLQGDTGTIICMGIDVTRSEQTVQELKLARKELEEQAARRSDEIRKATIFVSSVLENIPDMIFVKEARELRFVRFNKAGEVLLGYPRGELIGKNDFDFFPETEARFFTSKDRAVLESGKLLEIAEEPIHTRTMGTRTLRTKKIPIYDEKGEPEYLLGISEDITEKKQAEEVRLRLIKEQAARAEAEKAVKMRDEFLAIASHELKTPLTALAIHVHLISRMIEKRAFANLSDKESQDIIATAKQQVDRFRRLVENLLDSSRITSGRLELVREPVDLSGLVHGVVQRLTPELLNQHCSFEEHLQPGLVGRYDRLRIEQAVSNLVSNAAKYGGGKPIEITTRSAPGKCLIEVRDHGIGIESRDQKRIFSRFERAVPSSRFGGLGLGLYITQQIIDAHGGVIRIDSKPGEGSTFTVELPEAA